MLISYQVKVEEVMQMHSYNHFLLLLISLGAVLHHHLIVISVSFESA